MKGTLVISEFPEANFFRFKRLPTDDETDSFTLTWFYRAFGLYQAIPKNEDKYFNQRTIDVGDRFMSLWICFNSILRKHYGETFSDFKLIKQAEYDLLNKDGILPLKEYYDTMNDSEYTKHLVELQQLLPIENMKNHHLIDFEENSLIKIIYEIRCNLFHGRKDPSDYTETRDFKLTKLAFFLLAPLVIEYARQHDLIEICVPTTICQWSKGKFSV